MDEREVREMMGDISAVMKSLVSTATAPILARIEAIEARLSALPTPRDGEDADPEKVADIVSSRMAEELDHLRAAVAGINVPDAYDDTEIRHEIAELRKGMDAPSGPGVEEVSDIVSSRIGAELDELRSAIANLPAPEVPTLPDIPAMVKEAVDAIEKPQDGHSPTTEEILPLVEECVSRAVSAIPVPKDGVNLAGAIIDRAGNLVVTLSDGSTRDLGPVVGKDGDPGEPGKDGKPGKDGIDGVGFDDMDLVEDERGVFLVFAKGDVRKEFRLPIVIDRGVFKEHATYSKGDGVTWGGSFWICQGDAEGKPDSGKGWRLAVKKGRDGKVEAAKPATPPKVKV